jgi:N-succinyldiaminopimelate aminotransferase
VPALVDALVEKLRSQNDLPCERASVLVTAGATGALGAAIGMLAAPSEEILMLAPYWPLIPGIARAFRAIPVDVPFYDRVDSPEAAVEAVRERITPRSVALYVSTPSNPTGRVLPAAWLEALAEFAREQGLWILSDEVYEAYVYGGRHVSIGRYAPERTLSAFSFSKTYGMAGNRIGYLTGPPEAIAQARKISTHTFYAAPTPGQLAALRALQHGDAWVRETREAYRRAAVDAAAVLGQAAPEGACFLFLDVTRHCADGDVFRFLEECLDDGVVLAPGLSCGREYAGWVRLCFTSIPPEETAAAVRLLAKRLR